MTWILFILWSCGPGCVQIQARPYQDFGECQRQQIVAGTLVAWCEKDWTVSQ